MVMPLRGTSCLGLSSTIEARNNTICEGRACRLLVPPIRLLHTESSRAGLLLPAEISGVEI